jgi:putative GTP pyrophosphokinase
MNEPSTYTFGNLHPEYLKEYSIYENLCESLKIQISTLISQEGINIALPIEYRVKSWDSIVDKCNRTQNIPNKLSEISDVAGVRIILLFINDLKKVCNIIENNFMVLNKEDITNKLGVSQFGYGSIHYDVETPDSWCSVPTLRGLKGFRAEIQVRTASQHIWAVASHVLQYKHESDIPLTLRRSINRLSALLETVDLEFERLVSDRNNYLIKFLDDKETLNVETLRRVLDELFPPENKVENEPYAETIEECRFFDIVNVKQLKELINKHLEKAKKEDSVRVLSIRKDPKSKIGATSNRIERGVFFTHMGLFRNILRYELGAKYDNYLTEKHKKSLNQK